MKKIYIIMIVSTIVFSLILIINFIIYKDNLNTNEVSINNSNKELETYAEVHNHDQYKELPIYYNDAVYQYDTSTPEKTVGVADYVFVAKINKILRTEYRFPMKVTVDGIEKTIYDPFTVYDVTIIQNIKGEITEKRNVEVVQYGGLNADKTSYSFMEDMGLLNVGEYYILLACASPETGELRIEEESSVVLLENIEENELEFVKNLENIKNTEIDIKDNKSDNKKPYSSASEIVSKYVKAADNEILPEGKVLRKSKLYDKEVDK